MKFNICNIYNINSKNDRGIIFQPIQILLFHGNESNLQHIKYFHNITTTPSTPSFNLSLSDNDLYSPIIISNNSRRNSVFSYNSSIHSFHYDTLDTTTTTTINNKEPDVLSSYTHSINKLRNSNKVKDKALLFERLLQEESNEQNYNNHLFSTSSPLYDPLIYKNKSYSVSDDIMNPNIKNLSKNYLEQIERDKSLSISSSSSSSLSSSYVLSSPNIHKTTTKNTNNKLPPSKRKVSLKLSQYQNHINKLNENTIPENSHSYPSTESISQSSTSNHNSVTRKKIVPILGNNNSILYEKI